MAQGACVAFEMVETWVEERRPVAPALLSRVLDQRWLRNGVAFSVSLAFDAGLIAALISLGKVERAHTSETNQPITTFDLPSVTAQSQGAIAAPTISVVATSPPSPSTTLAPPQRPEWSITTLPPAAAPVTPAPERAAPAPVASGMAAVGTGSGAGYDPYAFASYQKPDPARLAAAGSRPLQPLGDAVGRLTATLRGMNDGGQQITLRAYVDPAGRIIRAELLSSAPQDFATRLADRVQGFQLCEADPTRPSGANLVVTLAV